MHSDHEACDPERKYNVSIQGQISQPLPFAKMYLVVNVNLVESLIKLLHSHQAKSNLASFKVTMYFI